MFIFQHNFDRLIAENNVLRAANLKLLVDIDQFRKNQKNQSIIKLITAHLQTDVLSPINADVQAELEKRVRDELKVVYGQKIDTAKENMTVYNKLVSSRTFQNVYDKSYAVTVKFFALIGTELNVWFTAKEVRIDPLSGS